MAHPKPSEDRRYMITLTAGTLLLLVGVLIGTGTWSGGMALAIANAGLVLITLAAWTRNHLGMSTDAEDRMRRICTRALAHSWLATFVAVNVLLWLAQPHDAAWGFGAVLVVMTLSICVLPWVYKRQAGAG